MIAISYRREDSTSVAGRLHDRLQADFGRSNVFMDFDSIPFGVDFREQIKQTLERAKVVIAVIGPMWLGGRGKGNRRINDPSDFVRLEIATALQRGIPVIPVLIDDTSMPQVEDLPTDLQGLVFRNALVLDTGVDFHHHADRLIAGIRELVKEPAAPIPTPPAKTEETKIGTAPRKEKEKREDNEKVVGADPGRRKKMFLVGGGVLAAVLIAAADWYFFARLHRAQNPPAISLAIATPVPVISETPTATPLPTATVAATAVPTLAPAPTPVVVVTPIPIPLPPIATPSLSVSNMITDDEVRAFITEHYRATERKDVDYMLSQYDDLVDYHTDGRRDKAFIRNDNLNYFRRWPVTSFTVGDIRVLHSTVQNTVTAYFEIRYLVRDPASNRSKQGRANDEWTISKPFGALKIISEKETVHGEAPERRRSRH
jgi:hypothetical protein